MADTSTDDKKEGLAVVEFLAVEEEAQRPIRKLEGTLCGRVFGIFKVTLVHSIGWVTVGIDLKSYHADAGR